MKPTKFALLLVVVFSMLLLSAVSVLAQDTIELGVTWWGSQNRHDRTIAAIEMFEAENPGIDIVYEFSGWGDYWTRVNTQAAGGNIACVMQQDYAFVTEWATRGLLLPLDELYDSGAIDISNIDDAVIASGQVDGVSYALSLGTNSQTYILDADAFEAAGIELPAWDWTWDDFEAISNQFAEDGIWGMAYGPWDDQSLKSVLISSGQWMFNEDGTGLGIEDPAPLIEHMERIKRMMDAGAIAPMDMQPDLAAAGLEGSPIVTSAEGMRYQWSNQVVALSTAAGEGRNFVLYPLPRVADGVTPNYLKPSQFFSITEGCAHVDEAAQFINFVTNDLEANDILFAERGVPVSSVIREHLVDQVDPVTQLVFQYIEDISEVAVPVPSPDPAGWSDIVANVITPQFTDPVLFGMISAEEGYEIFAAEANNILAGNAQ
jgi:multiple sugar transport system substrate-binding protein